MAFRKFWMVLGSGTPTYKHANEESANAEAERLALQNRNTAFYVLSAVGKVVVSNVRWDAAIEDDNIPF